MRRNNKYSLDQKLGIVTQVAKGDVSVAQIARDNLMNISQVKRWAHLLNVKLV